MHLESIQFHLIRKSIDGSRINDSDNDTCEVLFSEIPWLITYEQN